MGPSLLAAGDRRHFGSSWQLLAPRAWHPLFCHFHQHLSSRMADRVLALAATAAGFDPEVGFGDEAGEVDTIVPDPMEEEQPLTAVTIARRPPAGGDPAGDRLPPGDASPREVVAVGGRCGASPALVLGLVTGLGGDDTTTVDDLVGIPASEFT